MAEALRALAEERAGHDLGHARHLLQRGPRGIRVDDHDELTSRNGVDAINDPCHLLASEPTGATEGPGCLDKSVPSP
jgi:hypothetical protein